MRHVLQHPRGWRRRKSRQRELVLQHWRDGGMLRMRYRREESAFGCMAIRERKLCQQQSDMGIAGAAAARDFEASVPDRIQLSL